MQNKGNVHTQTDISSATEISAEASLMMEAKVRMEVPFVARLAFLFSGKMAAHYAYKKDSMTTITSTEISNFEILKNDLTEFNNVQVFDIENSSTFLRVAGGYLKMIKGGIEGVDTKEFKEVMDSYEGYDTYRINEKEYIRFNNAAFVSNYKRNDLLTTKMTIYCIEIGSFYRNQFDFMDQIEKMKALLVNVDSPKTLADIYPPKESTDLNKLYEHSFTDSFNGKINGSINLYDVVYACVSEQEVQNGK